MADQIARQAEYVEWIRWFADRHDGDVNGECEDATDAMVAAFPELRRVRGHVTMLAAPDGDTRPWPHWWCVTPEGEIVDPTRAQFPGPLDYEEHDEDRGEPSGVCPNCSGLVYGGGTCCSDRCHDEYASYVMGDL